MAATLAEPVVLAAAKNTLYPDLDATQGQYAVTETQFTRNTWGDWPIPATIHARLSPFNRVRLAAGEPDLLGVGMPALDVLNGNAASTPVVVVEAKGHNSTPANANIARGIEQAHAHLPEVNLGYVAAPVQSVTDSARSLARELNVGIIGVRSADDATLIEPARVAGAGDVSTDVEAIQFQASTHQLTAGSFPVNHPKNYLGYVLALAAAGDTEETYAEYVIQQPSAGRRGAILLGLVNVQPGGEQLTHLGADVVRFAREQHGSIDAALEEFDAWTGRRTQFTEYAPRWAQLARSVAIQYEPTQLIIDALERLHGTGTVTATLPELVQTAYQVNPPLTVEVFFTEGRRDEVLTADGDLDEKMLQDPSVYKSGAHFQFKAQLYHVGLLTSGGKDDATKALTDEWRLEYPTNTRID